AACPLLKCHEALADQVLVLNDGPVTFGQHNGVVNGEDDKDCAVVLHHNVFDLADLDPGDAHEVAGLQSRGVGEDGLVGRFPAEPDLAELGEHQSPGQQAGHDEYADSYQHAAQARHIREGPSSSAFWYWSR